MISITIKRNQLCKENKHSITNQVKVLSVICIFLNIVAGVVCLPVIMETRTLSQNLQQIQVCHMQTSEQPRFMEKEAPCLSQVAFNFWGFTLANVICLTLTGYLVIFSKENYVRNRSTVF